jgi:hypothetical protein
MGFSESAAFCGAGEGFDGDEFAEDGGPAGGDFEVIKPGAAELRESCEEDGCDGIFLHAFVESISKFLEAGGAVDGERDARGSGDDGAIRGLPVELAAFAIGIETIVECDVECGFESEELEDSGERGGESEASAGPVSRGLSEEVEKCLAALSEVIAESCHGAEGGSSFDILSGEQAELSGFAGGAEEVGDGRAGCGELCEFAAADEEVERLGGVE